MKVNLNVCLCKMRFIQSDFLDKVRSIMDSKLEEIPDLWLVSSEGFHIPTHSFLLTLHSRFMKDLLSNSHLKTSVNIPIPALPLSMLISLLRKGNLSLSNNELLDNDLNIMLAARVMGIDMNDVRTMLLENEAQQPPKT